MSSDILIEIIGGIIVIYVFIFTNHRILEEMETHKIKVAAICTTLLLCAELSIKLFDEQLIQLIADIFRMLLCSILAIQLSCLIDSRLSANKKYLFIPIYIQLTVSIFYMLYKLLAVYIITNLIIRIYCLFLMIRSYYVLNNYQVLHKPFLFTGALLVIGSYIIEPIFCKFSLSTIAAIFLFIYYTSLQEKQLLIDALTSIQNRLAFDKMMAKMQKENNVGIVVLNLNNLKKINDVFGHLNGDACLKALALLIKTTFEDVGISYRIGGDEFCVLCYQVDQLKLKADLCKLEDGTESFKKSYAISIDVAYGFAVYDRCTYKTIYDSFAKADLAMYEQKAIMKKNKKQPNR